jgi:hypothetical protein
MIGIRMPIAIVRGRREPRRGSVGRERQRLTRGRLSGRQERGLWDLGLTHHVRVGGRGPEKDGAGHHLQHLWRERLI